MAKLETFLKENKLDARRIVQASNNLERFVREDYALKLIKRRAKGGTASDAEKEKAASKPRSGRPISAPALARALKGETVNGATKTRILRAVNHLLEQKKKPAVDLRALW